MGNCGCKTIITPGSFQVRATYRIEHCPRHSEAHVAELELQIVHLQDHIDAEKRCDFLEHTTLHAKLIALEIEYDEEVISHDIEEAELKAKLASAREELERLRRTY